MLDSAFDTIGEDLALTKSIIVEQTRFGVELADSAVSHIASNSGKMIRPAVFLLAARASGATGHASGSLSRIAAAIELLHTASLMHDDVVDSAATRRGTATANAIWGSKASVLAGDLLWSIASRIIVDFGNVRLTTAMLECVRSITLGEMLEMSFNGNAYIGEDDCLKVMDGKTASLFSLAAEAGGLVASADEATTKALASFGRLLGMAYQLSDDALDYSSSDGDLGKSAGNDLSTGTPTYPFMAAMRLASDSERTMLAGAIASGGGEEAAEAVSRIGGIEATLALARDFSNKAKVSLEHLPDSRAKNGLSSLVDFISSRSA